MRITKFIFVIVILTMLLSACNKGEEMKNINMSNLDANVKELITIEYNDEEINRINEYECTMFELNEIYPIECIRETENGYRVTYWGEKCILELFFDKNGSKINGKICIALKSKYDFEKLVVGKSLQDVRILDPKGDYLFLYTGRNDIPKVSTHYTKDGYLIKITYDEKNQITRIDEELI